MKHLVVAGMHTERCVDATCRGALSRDYHVILAADAHSSAGGALSPDQIIAHHNYTLARLRHPTNRITVRDSADIQFKP